MENEEKYGPNGCMWKAYIYIDPSVSISSPEKIEIADYVHIQPHCQLFASGGGIKIGTGTILAHEVQILTRNHMYDSDNLMYVPYDERYIEKKVNIGDYVWIGARVMILPGVTIGKGAVIGAGAIVTRDIPDYAVAAGNPAKVLKYRNKDIFEQLVLEDKGYIKNKKNY